MPHTHEHLKPVRDRSAHRTALGRPRRGERPAPRGGTPAGLTAAVVALAMLLTAISADADPASATYPGTTNGRLAFAIDFGDNADIYSVMPNGEGLRRLTDNPGFDACPAYSADGKQIAYCSGAQAAGGGTEIWVMKANGTQRRQVTTLGGRVTFPDFSPDASRIVFAGMEPGATDADVFVIGADGTGLVQLTNTPTNDRFPAWSPDGSRIVFVSDRTGVPQIWLMNANGSDPRQLTFDPARKDQLPDWSPDGTMIAYATLDPALGSDIWIVNADGSGQRRVTNDGARQIGAAWSPDGTQIAFLNTDDRFVYVINDDGTGQHVLRPEGLQFVPGWQPRGARTP